MRVSGNCELWLSLHIFAQLMVVGLIAGPQRLQSPAGHRQLSTQRLVQACLRHAKQVHDIRRSREQDVPDEGGARVCGRRKRQQGRALRHPGVQVKSPVGRSLQLGHPNENSPAPAALSTPSPAAEAAQNGSSRRIREVLELHAAAGFRRMISSPRHLGTHPEPYSWKPETGSRRRATRGAGMRCITKAARHSSWSLPRRGT